MVYIICFTYYYSYTWLNTVRKIAIENRTQFRPFMQTKPTEYIKVQIKFVFHFNDMFANTFYNFVDDTNIIIFCSLT